MILHNVCLADTGNTSSIQTKADKIVQVADTIHGDTKELMLTFSDALIFPGLINSHDHLDFNLFPALGNRKYESYTEWGNHIHQTYANEIAAVLNIPTSLRERWGVYKNLLCGVTTVVNHGEKTRHNAELITVLEQAQSLHSVRFEKKWKQKLNNPFKRKLPVVMHVGEGITEAVFEEIDEFIRWNILKRKLIGVHGVSMDARQSAHFQALVWCPESNFFLLNATASMSELKKNTTILFGSDSTLTGHWDIWEHLRLARKTKLLTDFELYHSLNEKPAAIWQLNSGKIATGFDADLVVTSKSGTTTGYDAFYNVRPKDILLVTHKGHIRLFDESLYEQLSGIPLREFTKIGIGKSTKFIAGDVRGLLNEIRRYKSDVQFPITIR
ncbi:amidohydrolase family protein [Runella sp.]|uniref:amidohydrolase family protein n=1 Tax=Runella sp. TaxID=1960881 RepID=UPI003D0E95C7